MEKFDQLREELANIDVVADFDTEALTASGKKPHAVICKGWPVAKEVLEAAVVALIPPRIKPLVNWVIDLIDRRVEAACEV